MRRPMLRFRLVLAALCLLPVVAQAQAGSDVVSLLRQQRFAARSAELLGELGTTTVPRGVEPVGALTLYKLWHDRVVARRQAAADSLLAARQRAYEDSLASLPVTLPEIRWAKTDADAQGSFLALYREAFWQAIASPQPIDTVATPELRARLNGLFGAPTRNAAAREQEGYAGSEYVQFEYWLVANDSIAVLVLDRDGPFGRGLLIAADEAYAPYFALLKADLATRLLDARPTPYADYYHSNERRQWFRTGYDGTAYFTDESRTPRWAGRRSREEKWRIFR